MYNLPQIAYPEQIVQQPSPLPLWFPRQEQPGSEKQAQSLLQRRKRRIQYSSGKICGIIIEAWMFEKKLLPGAAVFFCFMHFFVDK